MPEGHIEKLKRIFKILGLFFLLVIFLFGIWLWVDVYPRLGTRPGKSDQARFLKSPQYNSSKKEFQNRLPKLIEEMRKKNFNLDLVVRWFSPGVNRQPGRLLPEMSPDLKEFMSVEGGPKAIWFGHSTILVSLNGRTILFDPVFSKSASPVRFLVQRFQKPVLSLQELPPIDFVVISHDHYDHLDMDSIQFLSKGQTQFVVPLGVGSHLRGWGVKPEQIREGDWWETLYVNGYEFTPTPAQHFSGRDGVNNNETLWASWVLVSDGLRLFFSGDSGYDIHFKKIGDQYGPFDVAFLENGQYDKTWYEVHMPPEKVGVAFSDLRGKKLIPIHWGMFVLAFHTWDDPVIRLVNSVGSSGIDLEVPRLGEVVYLKKKGNLDPWWSF